ncbi:phage capsid protein, partial [Salmonella enterica]|nr:phage capsid protein [Salmonella enterica]
LADTQGGVTFGFTAQFGSRVSGSIPDPDMGMRGGQRVRVGESVRELIVAQDCGYFFQNAVSA